MTRTPRKTTRSTAKKASPSTSADEKPPTKTDVGKAADESVERRTSATEESASPISTSSTSSDPTTAPSTPNDKGASGRGGSAWIGAGVVLLVLGALVAGGVASRDVWWPFAEAYLPKSAPPEDPRVTVLMDRLGALEEKVESQETETASADATFEELEQERARLSAKLSAAIERLESVERAVDSVELMAAAMGSEGDSGNAQQSLMALTERMDSLEKAADIKPVVERLDSLEELNRAVEDSFSRETKLIEDVKRRIDSLEAARLTGVNSASSASALILAIGQLRTVVRDGRAYEVELGNVNSVVAQTSGSEAMLAVLQAHAADGVASRDTLRQEFQAAVMPILQADRRMNNDGWISEAVNRLSDLVTVRRLGDAAEPDSVDARIARAEADLVAGDLAAAIDMLNALTGESAAAAGPWLERARATLAVEQALTDLNALAISRLSAAQG